MNEELLKKRPSISVGVKIIKMKKIFKFKNTNTISLDLSDKKTRKNFNKYFRNFTKKKNRK